MGDVKLTKRERDALDECGRHSLPKRGPYWWRVASMEKLKAHGLVEEHWNPAWGKQPNGRLPHRITDAGRAALLSQGDTSNG